MRIDILSLFPGYFKGPFDESIIKRAIEKGLVEIHLTDIRNFAKNRHRKVDDRPYGGGAGMVLMPQPTVDALRSVKSSSSHRIYLSPQGKVLTAAKARELASKEHLILLSGHYEGVDQRVIDLEIDEEISIGDYVLTNGSIAAIVLVDAVVRLLPGVLGNEGSALEDSFEKGRLDWPHYTRPEIFEGMQVPDPLLSGNHQAIADWRETEAWKKTERERPDLITKSLFSNSSDLEVN